ncbi:MAG: hypothetical protein P4L99_26335 [Chthoniobacter sp.]|nr:hypothetical protein [Chthoniobacter sp.]
MNKVNPYAFYQFGQIIQPLMQIAPGASVRDWTNSLSTAQEWVRMTSTATILGLRVCVNHAQRLEAAIKAILDLGQDGMITPQHSSEIVGSIMDFQAVFQAEMNDSDTYIVPQRSIFSTHALIENGEKMFSPEVLAKMPELAINDVKQGTRCFAFELPTAAGFHFLRAVEEVIHLHYDVLAKGTPRPKRSAMGIYLDKLIELDAQPELVAVLKQIKDLHRNPLNHPDAVLDMPGAQMVMGLMQSAIFSMMKIVPDPAPTIPGLATPPPV